MNHTITIKNLGPIKEIKDFEIKNINAIIGESATGKSLLAKAIFSFNEPDFVAALFRSMDDLRGTIDANISLYLPSYTDFMILYNYGKGYSIQIDSLQNEVSITFSGKLAKDIEKTKAEIKKFQTTAEIKNLQERLLKLKQENQTIDAKLVQTIMDDLHEIPEDSGSIELSFLEDLNILNTIFIPATRSFVSDFDDLRLNYISRRNAHRGAGRIPGKDRILTDFSQVYRIYMRKFDSLNHPLMRGSVENTGDRTLKFITGKQRLGISEVSSGQKELFPILMILQGIEQFGEPHLIIIEEPEAHIFPKDQKLILDRIIEVANKTKSKILLTTHSPYILMAINNLIEAGTAKYTDLESRFIDFEQTAVQLLADGKNKSLLDEEDKLVNMDYIEKIETEIFSEFQDILNTENAK